jgi:mycofactocin precursor
MSEQTASATRPAEPRAVAHSTGQHSTGEPASPADESLVAEELLVEEVSIDGMCGVY